MCIIEPEGKIKNARDFRPKTPHPTSKILHPKIIIIKESEREWKKKGVAMAIARLHVLHNALFSFFLSFFVPLASFGPSNLVIIRRRKIVRRNSAINYIN